MPTERRSHLEPWMRDLKGLRTAWQASEFSNYESLARSSEQISRLPCCRSLESRERRFSRGRVGQSSFGSGWASQMPFLAISSLSIPSNMSLILQYQPISAASLLALLQSPFFLAPSIRMVRLSTRSRMSSKVTSSSSFSQRAAGFIINFQISICVDSMSQYLGMHFLAFNLVFGSFSSSYISQRSCLTVSMLSKPYPSSQSLK